MIGSNALQAVTLLSQSISVAASVVEAVKTCGDSTQKQGESVLPEIAPLCVFRRSVVKKEYLRSRHTVLDRASIGS